MINVLELPQAVQIKGNFNSRHFEGYKTTDNLLINGRLIRSGTPINFSDDDFHTLIHKYGMNMIIDMRSEQEAEEDPIPSIPGVKYINLDLKVDYDSSEPGEKSTLNTYFKNSSMINDGDDPGEIDNIWIYLYYLFGGTPEACLEYLGQIYLKIVSQPKCLESLIKFFDILLTHDSGTIFFHCSAGKDRTGVLSSLILSALGANWDTCLDDYILTNKFNEDSIESDMADIMEITDDPDVIRGTRILLSANLEYMDNMKVLIDDTYGSMDEFLTNTLGLDMKKKNRLKELYTR